MFIISYDAYAIDPKEIVLKYFNILYYNTTLNTKITS